MEELKTIMEKFAASGWDLISVSAQQNAAGLVMRVRQRGFAEPNRIYILIPKI